jgi:hypothetical protein
MLHRPSEARLARRADEASVYDSPMPGGVRTRERVRRLSVLSVGATLAGWGLLAAPSLHAESFGSVPAPTESRCAAMTISAHVVNIGDLIQATAGPPTSDCGGVSSTVSWTWPSDDPDFNQIPGLVEVHPCAKDSTSCEFRARLFTQPSLFEGICIQGEAPQGAFSSCDSYAIRTGSYLLLGGTIFDVSGSKPITVHLSGPGGRQTTTTDSGGVWTFAARAGTYTVSFTANHKAFKRKVKVKGKPGTGVTLNLSA